MIKTQNWDIPSSNLKWDVVKMDQLVKSYFCKIKSSVMLRDKYPYSLLWKYKLFIYYTEKQIRID